MAKPEHRLRLRLGRRLPGWRQGSATAPLVKASPLVGTATPVGVLARISTVVAAEAGRSSRFASALSRAVRVPDLAASEEPGKAKRPSNRRKPCPFDLFALYAEGQEHGLRARLAALGLEDLRDIVAEHGMDTDRLAMKWKDPQRVVERIVERVMERSWKGSAFR